MRSPQELNENYEEYAEQAVIELDSFFDKKLMDLKCENPRKLMFLYKIEQHLDYRDNKIRNYLMDEHIMKSFIESCCIHGWEVVVDLECKFPHIIFRPKINDKKVSE